MLVPSSAYDRRVPAGMLLPFGLTCARIVLHDDPDPALASYCCPTGARTLLLCNRQDLAPLRLRNEPDKSSCRYAYEPC